MDYILPEHFLQEEERCGHTVTHAIKKLWAVELGCLKVLDDLCRKYQIRYCAGGGTLLGAVRHKGFIPWDDDIDVFMPFDDYKRFCEIASKEIVSPYFFQNYKTEEGFGPGFSRIRDSRTTGCTKYDISVATPNYNCGIFIDIFPLFAIEDRRIPYYFQKLKIKFWWLAIAGYESDRIARLGQKTKKKKISPLIIGWRVLKLFFSHTDISEKYLDACNRAKSGKRIGLLSFSNFNERFIWLKHWFDDIVLMPFEFIEIPCPKSYDPILRQMYGNYGVFVKGGQIHSLTVCDTDVPFQVKLKDRFADHE